MKMPTTTAFGKTAKADEKTKEEEIPGNPTTPPTTVEGTLKALEIILEHIPREPFKE